MKFAPKQTTQHYRPLDQPVRQRLRGISAYLLFFLPKPLPHLAYLISKKMCFLRVPQRQETSTWRASICRNLSLITECAVVIQPSRTTWFGLLKHRAILSEICSSTTTRASYLGVSSTSRVRADIVANVVHRRTGDLGAFKIHQSQYAVSLLPWNHAIPCWSPVGNFPPAEWWVNGSPAPTGEPQYGYTWQLYHPRPESV